MYFDRHSSCPRVLTPLQGDLAAPPPKRLRLFIYSLKITSTMGFALSNETIANMEEAPFEKHLNIDTYSWGSWSSLEIFLGTLKNAGPLFPLDSPQSSDMSWESSNFR